jgi:hypothetical protein
LKGGVAKPWILSYVFIRNKTARLPKIIELRLHDFGVSGEPNQARFFICPAGRPIVGSSLNTVPHACMQVKILSKKEIQKQ